MRTQTLAALILAALPVTACKIVPTEQAQETEAANATEAGDDARIASLLDETYAQKLLPLIADKALPLPDLRAAVATGLDAAGAAHGNRGAGEGAAWSFAVKGQGIVTAANLQSRARKAELDTDGDGKADVTLQLGPVIKGTSLRDVAPFYDFNDFRDQIEFAKLARAINDRASAALVLPEGDLTGKTLAFSGVVSMKAASDPWLVTVVTLEPAP